jgi:hypothetical protein
MLSRQALTYTAGVIRRHRKQIGSCWRKLSPGQQALLVLAYLRKGETFAELAAGFGIGTATAWRYVTETVGLLAARSPKLCTALRDAKQADHAYVVIDGTLTPVDRVAADRPFYSGKHHRHGMNLQVIASPDGDIVWVSGPLPGAVHDLTAARIWGILRELAASGLVVLAGKGYHGAGDHIQTPYKGRNRPASQKAANRAHAKLRSPGERANAQLKTWRILRTRGAVDIHAYAEGQVPSQVRAAQQHPQPGQAQRLAAATPSPGPRDQTARYRLSAVVFSAACTSPTRVSGPEVSDQSFSPAAAVGTAATTPAATSRSAAPSAAGPPAASSRADITHAPIGRSVSTGCRGCPR